MRRGRDENGPEQRRDGDESGDENAPRRRRQKRVRQSWIPPEPAPLPVRSLMHMLGSGSTAPVALGLPQYGDYSVGGAGTTTGALSRVTRVYPDFDPVTLRVKVLPRSPTVIVRLLDVAPEMMTPSRYH